MKTITLLIFALIFSPTIYAKPTQKQKQAFEDRYSKLPFDPKTTKIDNNFLGNYYPKITEAAINAPVKDEYETTQDFKNRLNKWQTTPFVGSLAPNNLMAIEINKDSLITSYDADKMLMSIHPPQTINVLKQVKEGDIQKGVTRMNIPFTYTTTFIREAVIENKCSLFTYSLCPYSPLTFNVQSNEAKQQKWRFFAIGHLTEPFYSNPRTTHEPRLDEQYLTMTETHKLHMEIYQLWIYSLSQQEVIAKLEIVKNTDLPYEIYNLFYTDTIETPSIAPQPQEQVEETTTEPSQCTPEKRELQRNGQIPWPLPCTDKEMDSL